MSEEIRKKIEDAAKNWAYEHSSAPDVDTPDWIIIDFKGGAEFGYQLAQEEFKKLEPSRDELWEELSGACVYNDGYFDKEKAKKRYRITRI